MRMRVSCLRLRRSDVWWLPQLVSEGLEKLVNIVMVTHDSSRDQAKAALRDLGRHGRQQVRGEEATPILVVWKVATSACAVCH